MNKQTNRKISPFQKTALALRQNGYSVLPLMASSKRPSIEGWSKYCADLADDATFDRWLKWEGSNIGVCCGVASGIIGYDLDNDTDDLHAKIKRLLPPTPVIKRGAKGETLFFQYNGQTSHSFSKNGVRVLDILSTGRQTVLPPSLHPDTGQPYVWLTDKTLENVRADDLPIVSNAVSFQIALLFESGAKNSAYVEPRYNQVYDDADDKEISEALRFIDCNDYDTWISVGMALKEELGEKGFQFWDNWSSTCAKYNGKEMRGKWLSFNRTGLTIASVFYLAFDGGYKPETPTFEQIPDFVLNGKKTGWHPKAEAVATIEKKEDDIEGFPARLLKGMGLPGIIADYMEKTAITPQPTLSLGCAIGVAGTIMAHRIRTETDLRTNFYTIGLAYSGAGKDHARKVATKLLNAAGMDAHIMGLPRSSAGLVSCLREKCKSIGFIGWDEFGRVLKQLTSFKAGTHERDIITTMLELFSTANGVYAGFAYANPDGKNPPKPIVQPCLSVYGTSVPNHFYEAMTGSDAIDGFLARLLVFESRDYTIEDDETPNVCDVPEDIINEVVRWRDMPKNAVPQGDTDLEIRPRIVAPTELARKMIKDYKRQTRLDAIRREQQGQPGASIMARSAEHARKLALVSSNGEDVDSEVMQWGIDVADHCAKQMILAITNNISSNQYQADTKRILNFIRDQRKSEDTEWVTKSDVIRKFQDIRNKDRSEIISSLVESNQVEEMQIKTTGRPKSVYRFCRQIS